VSQVCQCLEEAASRFEDFGFAAQAVDTSAVALTDRPHERSVKPCWKSLMSGGCRAHLDRSGETFELSFAAAVPHTVRSASVGDNRAALSAGSRPATAPMTSAAPRPPAQATAGITTAQPFVDA
jgi:hypothetical protein